MKLWRIIASATFVGSTAHQSIAQSEFHHEQNRSFYVGTDTDANFAECVEFLESLPQYVVDEISDLLIFDIENPITIRRFAPSVQDGDPFDALAYWFEPTDKKNEEYTVAASCLRIPEKEDGPAAGAIIYRVVYSYFASEYGVFESTNAAGYYINSIASEVTFQEF